MLIIVLVCVLALTGGGLAQAGDPTPVPRHSRWRSQRQRRTFNTRGFPISPVSNVSGHNHETHPSVAFNSGVRKNYLVVWQPPDPFGNQNIYGQFVKRDRTLIGMPVMLVGGAGWLSNPDVAYNPYLDQYLVVWKILIPASPLYVGMRLDASATW